MMIRLISLCSSLDGVQESYAKICCPFPVSGVILVSSHWILKVHRNIRIIEHRVTAVALKIMHQDTIWNLLAGKMLLACAVLTCYRRSGVEDLFRVLSLS
ncbi:hypothetical protein K2173_022833 [Erythroxylum novogranatense]|uniref:Uncharacterized protein n=1 Tax=Erythroxylum novogranatense TaxID=1862640 RepID=A0AAV8SMQ8_9ROSI|nr:hypothetical protein K2173_022833 [Erythroxylum novogranatense]